MHFSDAVCAEHLAEMVRFQTISNAQSAKINFDEFFRFHDYLEKTYPLVHKTLQKEVIGRAGLLYTWKGTGKSRNLPMMLIGHQDVVPAGREEDWNYPPFAGVIAGGRIWGRGANDCKSVILGHMEAIEALISEGFSPDFDVYLGYGYNEEVGGGDENSAGQICQALASRGVRLGIVIDEGSSVASGEPEGIEGLVAYIKLGEKGYADFKITVRGEGGHSMAPGLKSPVAEMGQIAVDLHNHPFPYRVLPCVAEEYRLKAPRMREDGELFQDLEKNFDRLLPRIQRVPRELSKFRSTMAQTMLSASPQANILPKEVTMVINSRVLEGDTVESLAQHMRDVIGDRAELEVIKGLEATKISRTDSAGFRCMQDLIEEEYPGVLVVPTIVVGGTDAKNYYPICDSVYRFSGFPSDGIPNNIHNSNENMPVKDCGRGPDFFAKLILRYASYDNSME